MAILPPFVNESFTDFSNPSNRAAFAEAIEYVRAHLGQRYPLHIGAEQITDTGSEIVSVNPARPQEVVGRTRPLLVARRRRNAPPPF
jgi:1-pyrroline-5-carboxylate dehydrogenase